MKDASIFQVVLLGVFGALAIGGILIFALFVGGGGGSSIGPITIWGPLDAGAFSTVLRQVSENESRLSQVKYEQKDPATYEEELVNALASGTGPDLFLMRQDYAFINGGKVAPLPFNYLPQTEFENTFIEAASPYIGQDGVLAIPVVADPLVMYWNRDLLSTAGIAQPPQFWDQLNEIAQKVVKRSEAGVITKAAIAFGEYRNVNNAKAIVTMLIQQAGGTVTARDTTGKIVPALSARTGGAQQAGEAALRFFTEFADPSKVDYSWSRALPEARASFAAGDLALYFGYASEASLIARTNPNLNFAVAPVPQIRGGTRSITTARVYGLAASRAGRSPLNAQTIATILASTDVSRALSVALGIPSARRDVLSQRTGLGNEDLFNAQTVAARSWIDPDPVRTEDIFRDMIEGITSGAQRVAEAIQRGDQEMAQILGL